MDMGPIEIIALVFVIAAATIMLTYMLTIMPFFWNSAIRYIDKRIEEEVKKCVDAKLAERDRELKQMDEEVKKREDTIILLKRTVGRKLDRDELAPVERPGRSNLPSRGIF
jgi:hypothetical protein